MTIDDTMLGLFKDFETTVIACWRETRDLSDHSVSRVYEAAVREYDAKLRGRRSRPHGLTGSELELYGRIEAVAEYRLGQGPRPEKASADVSPQTLDRVLRALRELVKSVGFHTRRAGRQGYLTYVEAFIPKS